MRPYNYSLKHNNKNGNKLTINLHIQNIYSEYLVKNFDRYLRLFKSTTFGKYKSYTNFCISFKSSPSSFTKLMTTPLQAKWVPLSVHSLTHHSTWILTYLVKQKYIHTDRWLNFLVSRENFTFNGRNYLSILKGLPNENGTNDFNFPRRNFRLSLSLLVRVTSRNHR